MLTLLLAIVPQLLIDTFPPRVVDPEKPFALTVHYSNIATTTATNVVVLIHIRDAEILRVPDSCTASNGTVRCAFPELAPGSSYIPLELLAPGSATLIPIDASITADQGSNSVSKETRTFRTYVVTSTADAGAGSLRDAMHAANAQCADAWPCKIAFRSPAAMMVQPATPLPLLQVALTIDRADAPQVTLRGTQLTAGNGITSTCPTEIRGLTIDGFPNSAIAITNASTCFGGAPFGPAGFDPPLIEDNVLGPDNERGLVIDYGTFNVLHNVVSGNRRSGIVVNGRNVVIRNNTIGLDREKTRAFGNGASGIYLGPGSVGTDVIDNYIGFNHHFGVSLDRNAAYSSLRGNSFQANWNLAIDYGLDGPTVEVPDASASNSPVRRPIITSAVYDPAARVTIIHGSSETTRERHEVFVAVYANDEPDPSGYGEGQYYLGEVMADHDGHFLFTYEGKTPGRWIAATSTRQNIIGFARTPGIQGICGCGYTTQTSEFSRTVEVQ